jgi:hypothetical protein
MSWKCTIVQIRFSVYIEEGAPRTKLYNLIGFLFSFFVGGRISSKPAEPGTCTQANYRSGGYGTCVEIMYTERGLGCA